MLYKDQFITLQRIEFPVSVTLAKWSAALGTIGLFAFRINIKFVLFTYNFKI